MTRDPIWKAIAETLAAEIARGHYAPGAKLPTEAQLARRFGVNRHTVRRATADL
ncbi:MAG TPA: GntR family transcriptional regulator, partial [Aliiroseovarius sp.]|nr:GntR family transcriptional regulator [Aliiroseovarius sp.]